MSPPKEIDSLAHVRVVINELIRSKYRSVELFAHEHGLNQSGLSRFLRGDRGLNLHTFLRIAEALEVDLGPFVSLTPKTKVADKKVPYNATSVRRSRVSVLLTETKSIEIKRDSNDKNPLVLTLT